MNHTIASNPAISALKGYYIGATIVDGSYTDLLFFTDEAARDAWVGEGIPSHERDTITPDDYQWLFANMDDSLIRKMLSAAEPAEDESNALVIHIERKGS